LNPPKWLTALGIPEECISRNSSAAEHGRSFAIQRRKGDKVWCIKLDDCWWRDSTAKKVDYLFWVQSSSAKKAVLLIELKGKNFGAALEQVVSTLQKLCKKSDGKGIHTGPHNASPGHDLLTEGGVRAYVVTSGGVSQRQSERERIRKQYGILVYTHTQRFQFDSVDALLQRKS
jgi:hypothetical protein